MKRLIGWTTILFAVLSLNYGFAGHHASAQPAWWPNSGDSTSDARSVWVYFSNEYASNYDTDTKVINAVREMNSKNADIIIASLTYADLANLSDPTAERTRRFQVMMNEAAAHHMVVYVGYWEEEFTGSTDQMDKYTRVDHVIGFNQNNSASDADIAGVVTDFEMHGTNRNKANYDKWRLFHSNLKSRIGTNDLKLLPVINAPDVWISGCSDCDSSWRQANGISGNNPYTGDVAYFSSYNNVTFADALIGMYYYSAPSTIVSKAHGDIVEAQGLSTAIIVGFSVGTNASDPSLMTQADVDQTIALIEAERKSYPNGVLGAMCWRWDKPGSSELKYRQILGSRFNVSEDAHVRGGAYANTNYGTSAIVEIKDAPGGTDYDRMGYLKMNFSNYFGPSASSAVLYFYLNAGVNDATVPYVPLTITGLVDDSWSENTITWNNRPDSAGATTIGTVNLTKAGWYSIDVTEFINSRMTDKIATFRLSDDTTKDRLVQINGKENTNAAYVIIK